MSIGAAPQEAPHLLKPTGFDELFHHLFRVKLIIACTCVRIFDKMDSFHVHLKLSNLKRIGNVFRFIEVCVFFIVVSRVSFQFQFPVGEYAKRFVSVMLSHRFVFVIGNVIVITLFAKSGRDLHPDTNSYNESVQKVTTTQSETQSVSTQGATERNQSAQVKKQIVQKDKLVNAQEQLGVQVLDKNEACFKRSYSECLEVENYIKPRRILRRTATEAASGGRCDEMEGCGDGMSDEEFRVMVETFIAKQQRSLREEEKRLSFC